MRTLSRYLKPYRWQVAATALFVWIQSASELMLPTIMADIVDRGVVNGDTPFILRMGLVMTLVALAGTGAAVGASWLSARSGSAFGMDLRNAVFSKATRLGLDDFQKIGTASMITRTTNDITQVQLVLTNILRMAFRAPLLAVGGVVMALSKDMGLSGFLLGVMAALIGLIVLIAKKTIPLFKEMQTQVDRMNLVLRERLVGIRVIRAFNKTGFEKERFEQRNEDLTRISLRVKRIMALLMPLMMLILNLTTVGIVWFGAGRIEAGALQVGDMMAFIQYAMLILFSLIMLTMIFVTLPRASVSAGRIREVLELETPPPSDDLEGTGIKRGELTFAHVHYRYRGAEADALEDISFSTKPGEITAIIGGTGSGKTTLVNLIPRLYDATGGTVKLDGVDIRDMPVEALRDAIGLVPQKSQLFSGSIMDNIKFQDDAITDEDAMEASKTAQAHDFVTAMDHGYGHRVEQGGQNLSGGQKQRLSIARAIAKPCKILILDDSLSALDFKTASNLKQALKRTLRDRNIIMVAQRITTAMDADRIVVLDDGRIAGIGTHRELIAQNPVYREIARSQLSEEELS